jgi:hypothetical protein
MAFAFQVPFQSVSNSPYVRMSQGYLVHSFARMPDLLSRRGIAQNRSPRWMQKVFAAEDLPDCSQRPKIRLLGRAGDGLPLA